MSFSTLFLIQYRINDLLNLDLKKKIKTTTTTTLLTISYSIWKFRTFQKKEIDIIHTYLFLINLSPNFKLLL